MRGRNIPIMKTSVGARRKSPRLGAVIPDPAPRANRELRTASESRPWGSDLKLQTQLAALVGGVVGAARGDAVADRMNFETAAGQFVDESGLGDVDGGQHQGVAVDAPTFSLLLSMACSALSLADKQI